MRPSTAVNPNVSATLRPSFTAETCAVAQVRKDDPAVRELRSDF
jgi:hypothetical protein